MSALIGIVAALPGEIEPLVRGWVRLPSAGHTRVWRLSRQNVTCVAVCSGMGSAPVTRAFARLCQEIEPSLILSVGWAGALSSKLQAGSVIRPETVVNAQTGERMGTALTSELLSLNYVADQKTKMRLRLSYPKAIAVDMEAATVARLCEARGSAFRAIKAISDDISAALPDLNPFVTADGQFAITRFVAYAVARPRYWRSLTQFGKHANLAAKQLAGAIRDDLGL